jgi:mannose-6-phosphate isomerase
MKLPVNCPAGAYSGSGMLERFRRTRSHQPMPQDWIASTVQQRYEPHAGLTVLPSGERLTESIADDPDFWLGEEHYARLGTSPGFLTKILAPGARLPVHFHPDAAFAAHHLSSPVGKLEAWYILDNAPDSEVRVGWQADQDPSEISRLITAGRGGELLERLNPIAVEPGMCIIVPAGVPHSIGPKVLLVEVQQAADLSLYLEWAGFALPDLAHGQLGLPGELVLADLQLDALEVSQICSMPTRDGGLFPQLAEAFRMSRHTVTPDQPATLAAGFQVLICVHGELHVKTEENIETGLSVGEVALAAYGDGALQLRGTATVLACRPPDSLH